jgi:hypothetical protein
VHRTTRAFLVKVGLSSVSLAVVVVQQAAETFAPMHFAFPDCVRRGQDRSVYCPSLGGYARDDNAP